MSDQQELLKLLEIISQRIQHNHDALWEEAKHYSWWVYIIFAGLIYLYFKRPLLAILEPWQLALLIGLGSLFGIFLSLIGLNAVYRESKHFNEARCIRSHIIRELNVKQSIKQEFDPIYPKDKKGLGIRKGFKITFIVTAALFLIFGAFSIWTLLVS
jgi:hypothetical protein